MSFFSKTPKLNYEDGIEAAKEARRLYKEKLYEEALPLYDKAIKSGVTQVHIDRAFCLQALEYHINAILDFDIAVKQNPNDCNIYFCRGNSKHAIGDLVGAVIDAEMAMELSSIDNEINRTRVKNIGNYKTLREFYDIGTLMWRMDLVYFNEKWNKMETAKSEANKEVFDNEWGMIKYQYVESAKYKSRPIK